MKEDYRFTQARLWTAWRVLGRLFRERTGHQQARISEALRAIEGELRHRGWWEDGAEEKEENGS